MTRHAKFTCRICDRRFGSLAAFDAHLGTDTALERGNNARLRGKPSQEGHSDPRNPKNGPAWVQDPWGIWRKPDLRFGEPGNDDLAGWPLQS